MNAKIILVTGATGQQGGAVARHLLKRPGFTVRALSRDPAKHTAQSLAQAGAELFQGDLNDPASLQRALDDAWGVFSVQDFSQTGYEGEIRQGKELADAAKAAGVRQFVYSSVVSADQKTGLPHFESKWQIEQHIMLSRLPHTILRPAFFMQNWYNFLRGPILQGILPLPLKQQTRLQQVSVEDIGAFAAMAFENPGGWSGRTVELAGDELTMNRMVEMLSRVLARNVRYVKVPWDQFRQSEGEEMARMYRWFDEVGYHVDIDALRQEYANLATLEQVLRRQDWPSAASSIRRAA